MGYHPISQTPPGQVTYVQQLAKDEKYPKPQKTLGKSNVDIHRSSAMNHEKLSFLQRAVCTVLVGKSSFPGRAKRACMNEGGGVRRQDVDYDTGPAVKLPMSMSLVPGHVTPRPAGRSIPR